MNSKQEGLHSSWLDRVRTDVRTLIVKLQSLQYRRLSSREVFEKIYASEAWGGGNALSEYNSGAGSGAILSQTYVETIKTYIHINGIRSVVDLGCGDFRVGRQLIEGDDWEYTGVDIVRPLIKHHSERFLEPRVKFLCRDIITEPLPPGDLCLVRQVLQHLDNGQIMKILEKLDYAHVIVSEHLPIGPRIRPNKDKAAGPDIRLYGRSGVFLESPPFNRRLHTLLEVPCPFNGHDAVLRTSQLLPR